MTFIIYNGIKKLKRIRATSLEEAEKIATKKYKKWTDLYVSKATKTH